MRWPTTLIVLCVIASVTALGLNGTVDGAAVTSVYGTIIGGVFVGHYVKTTPSAHAGNGNGNKEIASPHEEGL